MFPARLWAFASFLLPLGSFAATYNWVPTAAGTGYVWNNAALWDAGTGFPNLVGDIANVNINIAGNQTITLNQAITLGTLNLGDAASAYFNITLNGGTGGSLIFQNTSGPALLARNVNTSGTDVINADVVLNSPLNVSLALGSSNGIRMLGTVSGANGIDLIAPAMPTGSLNGYLELANTNNSYSGDTVISNGVLVFRGSVLSGQNSALGNATSAVKVGSAATAISTTDLRNGTATQLRLRASNDTDNYVFERDLDFSANSGTSPQNGRVRFALDGDGAGGLNTNTLTISGDVTLASNARGVEFLAIREGQTIYFTGQIASGLNGNGTVFWGPSSPGTSNDGRNNGTIRFSDVARTYANGQNLTGGTVVIEGSVGAVGTSSPIGTQTFSLTDGNGGNIYSPSTSGANRRIFMDTPGTTFARALSPGGGSGTNLAGTTAVNGVQPAQYQALYGRSGSVNLMNGYEFGGSNTSGTVIFSGNIAGQTVNVPVRGTAGGMGGSNVFTTVHNFALTAATGGTTVFSGVISGSTVAVPGAQAPASDADLMPAAGANNTRITINQFRNHANLDTNLDGIPDPGVANALVGTASQGTVVLTGTNTYGGGTEILGGTLLVNNTAGSGTGTGAVTVTAGALGGNGTIITAAGVTLAQNAIIRPGDASASGGLGVLTLSAPLTLNAAGGGILDFQISRTTSDINASNLIANLNPNGTMNWDAIAANSGGLYNKDSAINNDTLVINGTLNVNMGGTTTVRVGTSGDGASPAYAAGMVWDLMDWTTATNANPNAYTFEVDSALQNFLDLNNLTLDTSRFWDTGFVGIVVVPEPGRALLLMVGLGAVLLRRRRP